MHIPAWGKLVLVLLSLGFLFGPGIQHHWKIARDPYFVPFDAVQYLPAFFKFDANDPVPTTYIKEYFLNAICPPLYKASLALGARFADVRDVQLVLMYAAYGLFIAVMGRIGWLLGGAALSFAVMALTISAWIFIGLGFIGGAPRMYGYPLIAITLYALVRDRPRLLGLMAILGALLYPIVASIAGVCLSGWLILPHYAKQSIVSRWSPQRRLATLAAVGLLTVSCLAPLLAGHGAYGRRLVAADTVNYPEAGADGNYRPYDQLPYPLFGQESLSYYLGPLYSHGDAIAPWVNLHKNLDPVTLLAALAAAALAILVVVSAGLRRVLHSDQRGAGIRVLGFFIICVLLHVVAWLAAPYLYIPTRYLMFSLPFIVTLIFPWSLYLLVGRIGKFQTASRLRDCTFLAIIGVYLIAFGGRGNVEIEKGFMVAKASQPLFAAIAALPKNSLVAGWPYGEIKNIEYAARRNAFLTAQLHQVLHLEFVETMRQRMDAVFEAYFSVDAAPLRRLRDQFGVTHLLVETHHFSDPKRPPEYFSPWRSRIGPRLAAVRDKAYLMNASLQQEAAVFNRNGLVLLDLARLP
ncbi:MAG: hypothetical protein ACXW6J_03180 [Candidatus Binatia bacterium]